MITFLISTDDIDYRALLDVWTRHDIHFELSSDAVESIRTGRRFLEDKISSSDASVYGVNTGFGFLQNTRIQGQELDKLQRNLVVSHACGTGTEVPEKIVRLMMLLKIKTLCKGYSGIRLETIQRMLDFLNLGVHPVVFTLGSLGASGDLAPLAHLALPLIGEGEVNFRSEKRKTAEVLKELNLEPIILKAKEGLALLNGTQFMAAYGIALLIEADKIAKTADMISALSLEGFNGRSEPFEAGVHEVRPHPGQIEVAANIRTLLAGSDLPEVPKEYVQDPYSFRCIPQVHGASRDAIAYASKVFNRELNSVTDNPILFVEEDRILSAGNFHGQPLALALDFLGIALAELGSISERRTYQLISGQRGLPVFLVKESGINSGLMIPQYTAASVVSKNKQLATPASVDSIVSSNGQEDHVSMGANAATKAWEILENIRRILAIEMLTANQAFEFRKPRKMARSLEKLHADFRKHIPALTDDRILYKDIRKAVSFLEQLSPELYADLA